MLYLSRTQWGAQPPKGGAFTRLNRRRVTGVVFHHSGVERPPHGVNAVKAYERNGFRDAQPPANLFANPWPKSRYLVYRHKPSGPE